MKKRGTRDNYITVKLITGIMSLLPVLSCVLPKRWLLV